MEAAAAAASEEGGEGRGGEDLGARKIAVTTLKSGCDSVGKGSQKLAGGVVVQAFEHELGGEMMITMMRKCKRDPSSRKKKKEKKRRKR